MWFSPLPEKVSYKGLTEARQMVNPIKLLINITSSEGHCAGKLALSHVLQPLPSKCLYCFKRKRRQGKKHKSGLGDTFIVSLSYSDQVSLSFGFFAICESWLLVLFVISLAMFSVFAVWMIYLHWWIKAVRADLHHFQKSNDLSFSNFKRKKTTIKCIFLSKRKCIICVFKVCVKLISMQFMTTIMNVAQDLVGQLPNVMWWWPGQKGL